jgi:hypothetical protein
MGNRRKNDNELLEIQMLNDMVKYHNHSSSFFKARDGSTLIFRGLMLNTRALHMKTRQKRRTKPTLVADQSMGPKTN